MKAGDIAFKVLSCCVSFRSRYFSFHNTRQSNFGTYDKPTNMVVTRRADRVMEKIGPVLARAIHGTALPGFPEVKVTCKYLTEHRSVHPFSSLIVLFPS
jgi:hypothetical protein